MSPIFDGSPICVTLLFEHTVKLARIWFYVDMRILFGKTLSYFHILL